MGDVASREIVGLELVGREGQSGFYRGNTAVDDKRWRDLTKAHEDEIEQAHGSTRGARLKPDTEEFDQDGEKDQADNDCCSEEYDTEKVAEFFYNS